ncbi:MAG TPA: FliG C-terminal domain-containing protein [Spirochaetota bacterium]|nr:FliG C-terminal domain-containing protein [Spirochaetota bacterium]
MKSLSELAALQNEYSNNFNKSIEFASKKKYSRKETLMHLEKKGIFTEGMKIINEIYDYSRGNLKFKPDRAFFEAAVDFIEQIHKPFYVAEYRSAGYSRLETEWFTSLCRVLESYFQQIFTVHSCFTVLHAFNSYTVVKKPTDDELDSIARSLNLRFYPASFESMGLISYSNADLLEEILSQENSSGKDDTEKYEDEFFKYLEEMKIEEPAASEIILQNINDASAKYIIKHLDAYPDEAMEMLGRSLPEGKAVETLEFIAGLERNKRREILAIEKKYAFLFAEGILEKTGAPAGFTAEKIERLDMIRTARTISSVKFEETESYLKKSAKKGSSDPVMRDIKTGVFLFSDFEKLNDRCIQKILREVDTQDLVTAFCNASPSMLEALFRNMSSRAAELIKEDMEFLGKPGQYRIKKSREIIQNTGNRLLKSEDIYLE